MSKIRMKRAIVCILLPLEQVCRLVSLKVFFQFGEIYLERGFKFDSPSFLMGFIRLAFKVMSIK